MLLGKSALEEVEEQQPKAPHVMLGVRIVESGIALLLCHFWGLNSLTHPVMHALQMRGYTTT